MFPRDQGWNWKDRAERGISPMRISTNHSHLGASTNQIAETHRQASNQIEDTHRESTNQIADTYREVTNQIADTHRE